MTAENGSETEITVTFAMLQRTRFTSLPSQWNAKGSTAPFAPPPRFGIPKNTAGARHILPPSTLDPRGRRPLPRLIDAYGCK